MADSESMATEESFPQHLLLSTPRECIDYFDNEVFEHKYFTDAFDALLRAILSPGSCYLAALFGPSGVGKTRLIIELGKHLRLLRQAIMLEDPTVLAFILFLVPPPESGNPTWVDVYTSYLLGGSEPDSLVDKKIDFGVKGILQGDSGGVVVDRGLQVARLRRAVEKLVKYRKPQATFADEAQHFGKVGAGGARRMLDQMDVLKSLSDTTKTMHVLAGNYDLRTLLAVSDQLIRRDRQIHMPRYKYDNNDDLQEFANVLHTFSRFVPIAEPLDFVSDLEYFYEGCLGCVGLLKDWLHKALVYALDKKQLLPGLTLQSCKPFRYYLDHEKLPFDLLDDMATKIIEGERRVEPKGDRSSALRKRLGILTEGVNESGDGDSARSQLNAQPQTPEVPQSLETVGKTDPRTGKKRGRPRKGEGERAATPKGSRPFTRKPNRDSIHPESYV
jgi:hypothetical protein